jgi:hypothetical protein
MNYNTKRGVVLSSRAERGYTQSCDIYHSLAVDSANSSTYFYARHPLSTTNTIEYFHDLYTQCLVCSLTFDFVPEGNMW